MRVSREAGFVSCCGCVRLEVASSIKEHKLHVFFFLSIKIFY